MSEKQINPFKELDKLLQEAPSHLKRKVMNDVAMAKLVMDLASLFTLNYQSILAGLFKTNSKN